MQCCNSCNHYVGKFRSNIWSQCWIIAPIIWTKFYLWLQLQKLIQPKTKILTVFLFFFYCLIVQYTILLYFRSLFFIFEKINLYWSVLKVTKWVFFPKISNVIRVLSRFYNQTEEKGVVKLTALVHFTNATLAYTL